MPPSFCPRCGKPLPDNARFCGGCGAVMEPAAHPAPAPAQQPAPAGRSGKETLLAFRPPPEVAALPPQAAPAPQFALNATQPMAAVQKPAVSGDATLVDMPAVAIPPPATTGPAADATIVDMKAIPFPENAPPPASVMAPSGPSGKKTMLGIPAAPMPTAPAPAPQVQPPPAQGQDLATSGKKTMLGVAMPGIAPPASARRTEAPPSSVAPPSQQAQAQVGNTMLGVAMPGIAPKQSNPNATKAPAERPKTRFRIPTIIPMPAPLQEEALPDGPNLAPKRGVPIQVVVGIIAVAVLIGGLLVAFLWKGAPPLAAQPRLDGAGNEILHVTCEGCPDGTTATIDGAHGTFGNHEADVPLGKPLGIGDNPLVVQLDRPGVGRDEAVKITVPVVFRIRPDLTTLTPADDAPPAITIRVAAVAGAAVVVQDKPVVLDAKGEGSIPIALGDDADGVSDQVKIVDRKIGYTVTPKGGTTERGDVTVRVGIVPLHLDAPGAHPIVDQASVVVAGQTSPGATVRVNGQNVSVAANGVFSGAVPLPNVGDVPVAVISSIANTAPRAARFTVTRVASVDADARAKAGDATLQLGYDTVNANVSGMASKPWFFTGDVIDSRTSGSTTVLLVSTAKGCGRAPCLVRVVHGAIDSLGHGEHVRVFGTITRSVPGAANVPVPEVDASFVVKGRA